MDYREARSITKEKAEEMVAIENLMHGKELSEENSNKLKMIYSVYVISRNSLNILMKHKTP